MSERLTEEQLKAKCEEAQAEPAPNDSTKQKTTGHADSKDGATKRNRFSKKSARHAPWTIPEVEAYAEHHGFKITKRKDEPDGRIILILATCPFNEEHGNNCSCLVLFPDGNLHVRCPHNSCAKNGLKELLSRFPRRAGQNGSDTLDEEDEEERESFLKAAIRVLTAGGVDLFHDPNHTAHFSVPGKVGLETYELKSEMGRLRIQKILYDAFKNLPNDSQFRNLLDQLSTKALFEGKEQPVFVRIAAFGDRSFIDLGDEHWSVIEVSGAGWKALKPGDSTVRFKRSGGMLPLPMPIPGGSIGLLRKFIRCSDEGFALLVCWLVAGYTGRGPYAIACLKGGQGTGKSVTARMVRSLLDPNSASVRSLPESRRDAMIAASNTFVLSFDNLSRLSAENSDMLCVIATGGGFATRALNTNTSEIVINVTRPIMLNGIFDALGRPDLADRSLLINLHPIEPDKRKTEASLWAEFNQFRPRIMGALLDLTCKAMATMPSIDLKELPRMADFAVLAHAVEEHVPWDRGTVANAMNESREEASRAVLDGDPFSLAVIEFAERWHETHGTKEQPYWEGTNQHLLNALNDSRRATPHGWPQTPRAASERLSRFAPELARHGVFVDHLPRSNDAKRNRLFRLRCIPRPKPKPSEPSVVPDAEQGPMPSESAIRAAIIGIRAEKPSSGRSDG